MPEHTLRELAREYAKGNISREGYLQSRTELLEGIVSGAIEVEEIDFAPPVVKPKADPTEATLPRGRKATSSEPAKTEDVTDFVSPEDRRAAAASLDAGADDEPASNAKMTTVIVAVVVIVGIMSVVALLSRDRGTAPVPAVKQGVDAMEPESAPMDQDMGEAMEPNAASMLVHDFLQQKNWSDESLATFESEWQQLPEEKRAAAAGSVELSQMANEIYKRLLAVRALSSIDGADVSYRKQAALVEFSRQMGINDDRLVMPEEPAATSE